jgi:transposase
MDEKPRRGRPPTFTEGDRQHLAESIRQHGIQGTLRNAHIRISAQTLSKIAREFGIALRPGRRSPRAA